MSEFERARKWCRVWLIGFVLLITSLIASLITEDDVWVGPFVILSFILMSISSCIPMAHSVGVKDVYDDVGGI